ncbi:MAG: nucleotidyltransferase domain-containing protein [Planctomycetota bacterium]
MKDIAARETRLAPELREALAEIKEAIRAEIGDDFRLILYGSYARGDQTDESDVDLMLVIPDDLATFETKNRLRDVIGDFCIETGYVFSLAIVPDSAFRERAGFMAIGSAQREGLTL